MEDPSSISSDSAAARTEPALVPFVCNICGRANHAPETAFVREAPSCAGCKSTVRTRAIVHMISRELLGGDAALPDFPVLKGIRGIGISDSADYAERLAAKFDYTNTHYHKAPRFDVVNPPESEFGRYDFLIASEVFEHVAPPVERAFSSAYRLLKPNGVFLFTVPYRLEGHTAEHFPNLHDYGIAQLNGGMVLVNRTADGELQIFDDLVFHGGHGSTLEIRCFTEQDLRAQFIAAGFSGVHIYADKFPPFGVRHSETWSLPMAARKQPFSLNLGCIGDFLEQSVATRNRLTAHAAAQKAGFEEWVEWANGRIADLEKDLAERTTWAQDMERQLGERTAWAISLDQDLARHTELATRFQAEAQERTTWALQLQSEVDLLRARLERLTRSPWIRAGRAIGMVKE